MTDNTSTIHIDGTLLLIAAGILIAVGGIGFVTATSTWTADMESPSVTVASSAADEEPSTIIGYDDSYAVSGEPLLASIARDSPGTILTSHFGERIHAEGPTLFSLQEDEQVPESNRQSPSNADLTVTPGEEIEFSVALEDDSGSLGYVEWYLDGEYLETNEISGAFDTDSRTFSFDESGTYEVAAEAYSVVERDGEEEWVPNDQGVYWTVTVEKPVPESDRESPAEAEITVYQGEEVEFAASAVDDTGSLGYLEWYLDGEYLETNEISGTSDTDARTFSFDEPGTYEVAAEAFSAVMIDGEEQWFGNDKGVYWTVNVEERPPPESRVESPNDELSVSLGETVEFTVGAEVEVGTLDGTEWYVDGVYRETTHSLEGDSDSASWRYTFDEPGSYEIAADVFNQDGKYNDQPAVWSVTVEEPVPESTRASPSDAELTVTPGEEVEFAASVTDESGSLGYVEWYLDGDHLTTNKISGESDSDSRTFSFEEPGTYEVAAEAFSAVMINGEEEWFGNEEGAYWTVHVEAEEPDPVSERESPTSAELTASEGDAVEFSVAAEDETGSLGYVEWYLDGEYLETNEISGASDTDARTFNFDEPGTYEVAAEVYSVVERDGEEKWVANGQGVTWTVQVEEDDTDVPSTVNIEVQSLNGEEADEVFRIERKVQSITLRLTDQDGNPIRMDSVEVEGTMVPFDLTESATLMHESDGIYSAENVGFWFVGTEYLTLSVSYGDQVQTVEVPVVDKTDPLDAPIEGWRVDSTVPEEVTVEGNRYHVVRMQGKTAEDVEGLLVFDADGHLVTDHEIREKAALTATVSKLSRGQHDEEFLRDYGTELREFQQLATIGDVLLTIRDTSAEMIGVLATKGTGKLKEKGSQEIAEEFAREYAKKLLEEMAKDRGLLVENPEDAFEAAMKNQADSQLVRQASNAEAAADIAASYNRGDTWRYADAQTYWTNTEAAITEGYFYMTLRNNMFPDADLQSQIEDVAVQVADGATSLPVARMKTLLLDRFGYISETIQETAFIREQWQSRADTFRQDSRAVQEAAIAAHGGSDIFAPIDAEPQSSATIEIIDAPAGEFVPREPVTTTVEVTNTGDEREQFFVGYGAMTQIDGRTEFFDNYGTTGKFVTLAPDESVRVDVTWQVQQDATLDQDYGVGVAVWREFPEDVPEDELAEARLDEERRPDLFRVVEGSVIQLQELTVTEPTEPVAGDPVFFEVTVENTAAESVDENFALTVDGEAVSNKVVTLPAQSTETITIRHVFDEAGTYEAEVAGQQTTVTVDQPELQPPEAAFDYQPTEITAGDAVTFDASASTAPDTEIVSYDWALSGGGEVKADGESITHVFDGPGEYTVTLTVTDDTGATATAQATIQVGEGESENVAVEILEMNEPIDVGDTLKVTAEIRNTGSVAAEQEVVIMLEETQLTVETISLEAGEVDTVTATYDTSDLVPGDYGLEVRSGDGTASGTVTVDPGPAAEVEYSDLLVESSAGDAPLTITATATVENVGGAGEISVPLSVNGDEVTTQTITLDAGEATTIEFEYDLVEAGDYDVTIGDLESATVTVDEASESAVFDIENVDAVESLTAGERLEVTATIANVGDLEGTQEIRLDVDGLGTDSTTVTLAGGDRTELTLSVDTEEADAGEYRATVESGNTSTTVDVTVEDVTAPTADAGSNTTVDEDQSISFDGSASSDNVGIVSYEWDFDDGTTTTGATASHTYESAGQYNVTLTVTDDAGNSDTDSLIVTVEDTTEPTADAGNNQTVDNGTAVAFDASSSSDNVGVVSYDWSFGDGSTATGATPSYTYGSPGQYTATLTVTDDAGNTDTDSVTITVEDNTAPTADAGPDRTVDEETSVMFDASNSSDNGDIVSYAWEFGDGTTGTGETTTHTYPNPGDYTVTLTVEDDAGNTDTDEVNLTVNSQNTSPSASFIFSPSEPEQGEVITFDASESTDPDGSITSYEWDFDGDGTTDATGQTVNHSFSKKGEYQVTLTATDDTGGTNSTQSVVTVTETQMEKIWSFDTGSQIQYSTVAIGETLVFAGTLNETFYALYRDNGSVAWKHDRVGSLSGSSPVLQNGRVFVGSGGGIIYAFNATDGSVDWKYTTDSAVVSSPSVSDNTVYVGSNDGTVLALNATDGAISWRSELDSAIFSAVETNNGTVYLTTDDGLLVALNQDTGNQKWDFDANTSLGYSSPVFYNGTVYLAGDVVYALYPSNGTVFWEASYGGTAGSTPTIKNGIMYVGGDNGNISAIDISDGSTEWTFSSSNSVGSNPSVTGEQVLIGSNSGYLYRLNASTGEEIEKVSVGSGTRAGPTIGDSTVYIGSQDGLIIAFESTALRVT